MGKTVPFQTISFWPRFFPYKEKMLGMRCNLIMNLRLCFEVSFFFFFFTAGLIKIKNIYVILLSTTENKMGGSEI